VRGADGHERWRLRPEAAIHVDVDDRSAFGSPLTTRPDDETRTLFAPVLDALARDPAHAQTSGAAELLRAVVASPAFARVGTPTADGRWTVHDAVLHPDPSVVRWSGLLVEDGARGVELAVADATWPDVHRVVAALAGTGVDPDGPEAGHAIVRALADAGLLTRDPPPDPVPPGAGVTFLGHNMVLVRSATTAVLTDPLLRPARPSQPEGYRPHALAALGPLDAVLVTHSHPDHFAPGTLLQLPPDLPVLVPRVERETLFAVAMGRRLRELGHRAVVEVVPGDHLRVGDVDVDVLPFHGEQPTDGAVLHPDVRNVGVTYVVRTPALSVALVADSGRDRAGDVRDVATAARRELGPVDVVFAGYRGWETYPVQLLQSSVARYLLVVPPELWAARQRIMDDAHDALDVAERWGARVLVPYADGGAPWFWEIGLGPRLDEQPLERVGVDPFPERVADAAAARSFTPDGARVASPVRVVLLRPHDALTGWDAAGAPVVARPARNGWPYAERVSAAAAEA
jgi:L-ascorbate metabolism protein UlaG (beta-lactamase superfamily)